LQNFKAIQLPEVARRSIIDVEEIYQACLRTSFCDPNFTMGSDRHFSKRSKRKHSKHSRRGRLKSGTKRHEKDDDSEDIGHAEQSSDLWINATTIAETPGTTTATKYTSEDEEFQG
jgi:hypothetical protein